MIVLVAWRNIWRNKKRSLLSMTAITMSTIAILFIFSLLGGMQQDVQDNVVTYITGHVRVRTVKYDEHDHLNPLRYYVPDIQALSERITTIPGVAGLSPRIAFPALGRHDDQEYQIIVEAVDSQWDAGFRDFTENLVDGNILGEVPPSNEEPFRYPAVITTGLARSMKVAVGDRITVLTQTVFGSVNAMSFQVVGMLSLPLSSVNQTTLFVPLELGQRLVKISEGATEILIRADDGVDILDLSRDMVVELDRIDLDIRPWTQISQTYNMMQMAGISYTIIGLIFFLLGSVAIVNTTIMMIYERKREIGMLMSMGMRHWGIRGLFFLESVFMSAMGALVGICIGGVLVVIFSRIGIDFSSQLSGVDFDISSILYTKVSPWVFLLIFSYSVVVASLASFFPTRRVTTLSPVEALRIET